MLVVHALPARGHFEILGQAFVEPERDILEHAVQPGMGQFVPQVLLNAIAPVRVHDQVFAAAQPASGCATKKARRFGRSGYFVCMKRS